MKQTIRIDGETAEPVEAGIVEVEPGVFSILFEGASYEARVCGNEIALNGRRYRFEIEDPRQWKRSEGAAGSHGRVSIAASMPGKVVRILAKAGDAVSAGQGIIVIEAMKMQNELKTPREGHVTAILVAENESVNAGAVLAIVE